jgi:DegV family protein with EDD domain
MNIATGYSKKVPVLITTSNLCDLPLSTLRELQIDVLPFRIHVDGREYYDGIEADTDEILRYAREGKEFESEPPTVDEFEQFFASELKKAHQVIYITIASGISREYECAREASKNFGNVYIFNSEVNSSAMGLLVLLAYNMAILGMTPGNIMTELSRLRKKVHSSFITSDPTVLLKRGLVSRGMYNIMKSMGLRLFFDIKRDTFKLGRIRVGDKVKSYYRYVDYALPRSYKPDTNVVFVTSSGIPEDTLSAIGERIKRRVPFKNIIFQKASGVLALSCGTGSFGIQWLEKGDQTYNLEKMLVPYRDSHAYEHADAGMYHNEEEYDIISKVPAADEGDAETSGKWYSGLLGIDSGIAIANRGSEESFRSVLEIFYNTLEDRANEIQGFFDDKDWENYTIKVHALKSSARLIGAEELSRNSEALEMAGKEGNTDFINSHHEALIRELEEFRKPLSDIFEKNVDIPKDNISLGGGDMDDLLMNSMYEALESGIEQKNEALLSGTFKEMQDYQLPECCKGIIEKLEKLYKTRDYEGMSRVLKERK